MKFSPKTEKMLDKAPFKISVLDNAHFNAKARYLAEKVLRWEFEDDWHRQLRSMWERYPNKKDSWITSHALTNLRVQHYIEYIAILEYIKAIVREANDYYPIPQRGVDLDYLL